MSAIWPVIYYLTNSILSIFKKFFILPALFSLFSILGISSPVSHFKGKIHNLENDTIFISKGIYILSTTMFLNIPRDTFYIIPHEKLTSWDSARYRQSQVFYDTLYKKLTRKKITQLLYPLAFREPMQSNLPDSVQVLKSTAPFEEEKGKVIRNILITVLPPFGSSIYDTGIIVRTGAGKALNSIHRNTREYFIRRNLLIKKWDRLNPAILADNERILRDIHSLDNARIVVTHTGPDCDTVDLVILVKDVWSIGLDIPYLTTSQVGFRIYDANFLGLGDQITTKMSMDLYRSPFFRFNGLSYTFSNIGGSFINAYLDYTANDLGNQSMTLGFERLFITNYTKWAGGAIAMWSKDVNIVTDTLQLTSYADNEGFWIGRSFLLKGKRVTSRAIVAASIYRNNFSSRPYVSIDSNEQYYNKLKVLGTFSISKNNYYLTEYLLKFGKTESLPYGHLFQITVGVDNTDFYSRLYSGIHLSAGNYFNRFGYLAAYAKFGGFLNHSSLEDAVAKFNLGYFTPLLKTPDQRFKFRTFLSTDYRHAFNQRLNNTDYYNANLIFNIRKVNNLDDFKGVKFISVRTATTCFFPWYFYGFRFAFTIDLQAGLVAHKGEPLANASLFTGIGTGLIIKNDNLVFPAIVISGYFYPSSVRYLNQFQVVINSNLNITYYDYNVGAPYEETLDN